MADELHEIRVYLDGYDKPLVLHGGFDGYDDPYRALAEYGLFRQAHSGEIRIGEANLKIGFKTDPHR